MEPKRILMEIREIKERVMVLEERIKKIEEKLTAENILKLLKEDPEVVKKLRELIKVEG